MMSRRRDSLMVLALTALFSLLIVITGCKHEKPGWTYMPDMSYSPALKAQQEGATRVPPAGTIARGHRPYAYAQDVELAGKMLKNPLPRTVAVMQAGKNLFNTYCIVCHGAMGEGDGSVVPKFPRPKSLQTDIVKNYPDGRIFHIITMGQALMPSYASQVTPEERWQIVHYIRALYRAKHPTPADLKAAENF